MSKSESSYRQYICRACGLIYDEAEGDPDSGLAPGTRFEDIPDDWECPLCAVTKSDFELLEKRKPVAVTESTTFSRTTGIVVVGGGLAGWAAVEAIRELNTSVAITLVSACSADRYHKPELSVAFGRGLTTEKLIRETGAEAAARLGIHLLSHTFATGLTPAAHQLRTTRGTLSYTQLILAQGARPNLPSQFDSANCWRINDLRCWSALAKQLQSSPQNVAIIGAGMIGCELAEDIATAGHNITLVNRDTLPLAHLLPEKAGQHLLDSMIKMGITHRSEAIIESVVSNRDDKPMINFADGSNETFDQVIVATGLQTENRLAQQAGLAFNQGIVVDPESLCASIEGIYALGDCISIHGKPCRFIEPIHHQAHTIASRVLGKDAASYKHQLPVVRLKTRSLPIVIHGLPNPMKPWYVVEENSRELTMAQTIDGLVSAELKLKKVNHHQAA